MLVVSYGAKLNSDFFGEDYKERFAELIKSEYYLNWIYNKANGYPFHGTTPLIAFYWAHLEYDEEA